MIIKTIKDVVFLFLLNINISYDICYYYYFISYTLHNILNKSLFGSEFDKFKQATDFANEHKF